MRAAARDIQKSAKPRTVADSPEARREHGARRDVKKAQTSKKRANRYITQPNLHM